MMPNNAYPQYGNMPAVSPSLPSHFQLCLIISQVCAAASPARSATVPVFQRLRRAVWPPNADGASTVLATECQSGTFPRALPEPRSTDTAASAASSPSR